MLGTRWGKASFAAAVDGERKEILRTLSPELASHRLLITDYRPKFLFWFA